MSRSDAEHEKRPERVIILDADDPMKEIHGRIVWQEEHDRVIDETRRQAFADGYAAGHQDASSTPPSPVQLGPRRRLTVASRIKLSLLILAAICLLLVLPVLVFGS